MWGSFAMVPGIGCTQVLLILFPMGLPRADELLLVSKNSQSIARQV